MSQPPNYPPAGPPGGPHPGLPNSPTQHLPAAGRAPGQHPGAPTGFPPGPPVGSPAGPPPGYQPSGYQQPGYQQPGYQQSGPPPASSGARGTQAVGILAFVSLAATVIGLSVDENDRNAWDSVHAWGGVAILGALLTFAPLLRSTFNLTAQRAGQIAACGAAALALFWVLFVLPAAGTNTSLVTTIGAAAGIIAAWIAPGREDGARPPGATW